HGGPHFWNALNISSDVRDFKLNSVKFLVWCEPPACGLLPGRLLRPATRQRCAGIALRSRLARVPILWSVKLDLFPSFDDPTKFVSRDWHSQLIGFSLACLEHRSSSHLVLSRRVHPIYDFAELRHLA